MNLHNDEHQILDKPVFLNTVSFNVTTLLICGLTGRMSIAVKLDHYDEQMRMFIVWR